MENFEKRNTVESANQIKQHVHFSGGNEGARILFLGNSITLHAPKSEIGWNGNWGMAASSEENDYVHIVMNEVKKKYPEAAFCVVQGAVWERNYINCDLNEHFSTAKDFKPDVIISFVSENIPADSFDEGAFIEKLTELHEYLSGGNKDVKIIRLSNFFAAEEKSAAIRKYAQLSGAHYVEISDLIKDDINLAKDKFEHKGIQIHPGDIGMAEIAKRIIDVLTGVL